MQEKVSGSRQFSISVVSDIRLRKIDFKIDKCPGVVFRINVFEFHQSCRLTTKTIFLDKKGDEYTIDFTHDIRTLAAVEYVIGKSKCQFSLYAMRFIEHPYFYQFIAFYHTLSRLASYRSTYGIQPLVDALVSPVYLVDIMNRADSFGRHCGYKQGNPRPNIGRYHRSGT